MKIRWLLRTPLQLIGLLAAGIALGYLLLVAVYALPTAPIAANVADSAIVFDGSDESAEARNQHVVKTYTSTWLDNFTDSMMLLTAAYPSDLPVWEQALRGEFSGNIEDSPYNLLQTFAAEGPSHMGSTVYNRYWHGYLVVLKPLLLLSNYMDIRILNGFAQGALLLWLVLAMVKRGLTRYLSALALGLAVINPWILPLSLHYSSVYYVMLLGCIIPMQWPQCRKKLGGSAYFLLLGMATSYVDLLTYPLVTFGFPFVFWMLQSEKEGKPIGLLQFVQCGAAWVVGYLGMWAGKMALTALLTDMPIWQDALNQLALRAGNEGLSAIDALRRNLLVFWRKPYKLVGVAVLAGALVQTLRTMGKREPMPLQMALLLAVLAALPLLWFLSIVNHSHVHYFFTHRTLAVTVFAIGCLLTRFLQTRAETTVIAKPVQP